ncbi:MAG: sugar ABC transporter permease [Chloroflexi bacterium]|nr:sugar ABC transporter permease [Chloroflexota bacterium]
MAVRAQELSGGQHPVRRAARAQSRPWVFLVIPLMAMAIVAFVPLFYAIYIATHRIILAAPGLERSFVGLDNFARVLSAERSLNAFGVTFNLLVLSVGLSVLIGLPIAVLIYSHFRARAWLAVLLIIPMAIPKVVAALVWNILYNPLIGVINYGLSVIGLPEVNWLSDSTNALLAIAIVDAWQWAPFVILILLAGLEAVPGNFYEAAAIEGANPLQMFRHITFPLLRPFLTVAVIFRAIDSLRTFDYVFILTKGGPGVSTETVDIYAYHIGITESGDISTATAAALILLVLTIIGVTIWVRLMRWGEEYF